MVDAFKAAVSAFDTVLKVSTRNSQSAAAIRADEESTRIVGVVKQVRIDANAAFRTLAGRVNALALINGEAPYATFIDHVNAIIRQTQVVLTARRTRGEK